MTATAHQAERLSFRAAIFDMDGVVTRTADLHAAAWKDLFDAYRAERAARGQSLFSPFDAKSDYLAYVDGKPRYEGVRSFLAARGLVLPFDEPGGGPGADTIVALGRRKDAYFEQRLERAGAKVYSSTVSLIESLRARGVATAAVTSSRHGRDVLRRARITHLFDAIVDGNDAAERGLKGKPDPETFLAAAALLNVSPAQSIVFEDAAAGVLAGRRGHFGLVIGVDRGGNCAALVRSGADMVVADLAEVGVDRLERSFRAQAGARADAPTTAADAWRIEQEGFDPAREHEMESLFTVGNGYLGVRGALDMPLPGSQADMFVAGIYDRKQSELPYSELEFLTEDRGAYAYSELVPLPFPFRLRVSVDGRTLNMVEGPWRTLRRTLDLHGGSCRCCYLFEDPQGRRTTIETWRCASAVDPHLLLQEVTVTCENHDALVEVDTSLHHPELRANHPHVRLLEPERSDEVELRVYATEASHYRVAVASCARLEGDTEDRVYLQAHGKMGRAVRLRRYACVYTSRDGGDPAERARAHVLAQSWQNFRRARVAHAARWRAHWKIADVRVGGSVGTTQALRFNAYHLRIAAKQDPNVSIGARTLSGRAYEGHVFWDVEVFMMPYFVRVDPAIARSLLLYRYHTLDGARQRARHLGYRGACYAWESTVTGADATPRRILLKTSGKQIPIYTGYEQIHVTADIAYGIWRYFEASGDASFMCEAGAEILFETARFWASRCVRVGQSYHINAVTGPDEYHHTVNDNAYTNWMARFNLQKAAWAKQWLAAHDPARWEALREKLGLAEEEWTHWEAVARELYCPGPNADGVIEQFAGYFELRDYRVPESERFNPPLRRLFEAEEVNRSQLIKQADVLMLPFLFPERFARDALATNYRYYEPRTDHGSSLSPAVHAALAARLGLREQAEQYWRRALWLDLSNTMGNSALGVHAACMAGAWQTLAFAFLDIRFGENGPTFGGDPAMRVPSRWYSVDLRLHHRGRVFPVRWERGEAA